MTVRIREDEAGRVSAVRLTLPLPPTANKYWRNVTIRGASRTLLSSEARRYKQDAATAAILSRVKPIDGAVSVRATVYMARLGCDLDNRIKPTMDALRGVCFADDVQVAHLEFRKQLDRRNPRVEIEVRPLTEGEEAQ